eukprot:636937-Hanusia_phi.AAC.1
MHFFFFTPRTPPSCLPMLASPHPIMHTACLFALSTDLYPPSPSPDISLPAPLAPELLTTSGTSPTLTAWQSP